MIEIFPEIVYKSFCLNCKNELNHTTLHWQGVHVCADSICIKCKREYLVDLPINQARITHRVLDKANGFIYDENEKLVEKGTTPWFDDKLRNVLQPSSKEIKFLVEKIETFDEVLILNTIDFVYGHSLLELLNLQRLIKKSQNTNIGIIVIVQPMMKWLLPTNGLAEIWTVDLKFSDVYNYYESVSTQINNELKRFRKCEISNGYVLPTNENIEIENFTKIKPYNFISPTKFKPRITFIWREDPGRVWIKNIYFVKGFPKLGFPKTLIPFHYLKVRLFFYLLQKKLKNKNYQLTLAGFGKYGNFPNYIEDKRVSGFTNKEEVESCTTYAESELVIGVHGSSMLLPSALAGMTISMMPSKRWGNFAEDLLFNETDPRLAIFEKRIIPLNLSLTEIIDICIDMIVGRKYFIKKFFHSEIEL